MRLLSLGCSLPNVDIDNYNVLNAPSYFDYDAMYVDPTSITRSVAELLDGTAEFSAHDGRPVVNGSTTAAAVSAADQVRRRTLETQRLLEAGGVIVVGGRPNAVQLGVIGLEGCDRYSWLPAPAGMSWGPPHLQAAEGRTIRILRDEHPLAGLMREHRRELGFRAVFDDRQPLLRQHGRVIATGGSGVPHCVEFDVLAGKVIFMPAVIEETSYFRADFAERLMDAVRHILSVGMSTDLPGWARSQALPGLEQLEAELEDATRSSEEAAARHTSVRERHDTLAAHRRLLTADGRELADAVRGALELLGFVVTAAEGGGLTIEGEGQRAFVEVEGSRDDVVEWPYVRLQRRLEAALLTASEQLKGIVVANGHRHLAPEERPDQTYSEPLRLACENYRYSLVRSETLFSLVQRALGGADEAALSGMRRRILARAGLLTTPVALGDEVEEKDAGPIF